MIPFDPLSSPGLWLEDWKTGSSVTHKGARAKPRYPFGALALVALRALARASGVTSVRFVGLGPRSRLGPRVRTRRLSDNSRVNHSAVSTRQM